MATREEVSSSDGAADLKAVDPSRARVGGHALSVLATPLNLLILKALTERPMRLAELRKQTGLPAQTTLRGHLASLGELGVLIKRPTEQMPYTVENELTPMGRELLAVADRLESWLGHAPDGAISLESAAAKGAVKALIDGWGSTIMRALAARPQSLTELDSMISGLSYPALERRLSSMRIAGLVEARPSRGAGTPYGVTAWARQGVVPLLAASRCERLHMRDATAPLTQADIEAAFLLATPLVALSDAASGSCQLAVERAAGVSPAGVQVTVERGEVVSCVSDLEPAPGTYAVGSAATWLRAVDEGSADLLRLGGGKQLAEGLVLGLHTAFNDLR
ncbi:MAG TPA: winged helix-turn-helix transcriptional regulator [Solirubrobacterales bacterium]|nr:winged helix-turn-helix transcriptional regulator [Solirubrobacterales bacterium]